MRHEYTGIPVIDMIIFEAKRSPISDEMRNILTKEADLQTPSCIHAKKENHNRHLKERHEQERKAHTIFDEIRDVCYYPPTTVVYWKDGDKTVVTCQKNKEGIRENFDPEKGLALAILKKLSGNSGSFNEIFRKYKYEEKEE